MVKRLHTKKCDQYTKDTAITVSTYKGGLATKDASKHRNKLLHPETKDLS